jgi:hypothetical protein
MESIKKVNDKPNLINTIYDMILTFRRNIVVVNQQQRIITKKSYLLPEF